jgi:hypothetical protein
MYRENGMIFCVISDERYGNPKIARIIPIENQHNWGEYKELEGTEWERLIPVISEEIIDRALRGDAKVLMQSGLREPKGCLKLVPIKNSVCAEKKGCPSYTSKCDFRNKECPDCFSVDGDMSLVKRNLIEAWRRGYIVVRMLEF